MSLAWPLFRVTEQAALAAWPQTGCGDKNKIDGLAVTAMRQALNDVAFRGRVVIGEGNDILFSATGVTGGELVNGIQQTANGVRTQTLLIGGADQTCNIIDSCIDGDLSEDQWRR